MTGQRKGSIRHWLSNFEVGETRWTESSGSNRPPIRIDDGSKALGRFTWTKYCAVPQSVTRLEPVYLWKVTRHA